MKLTLLIACLLLTSLVALAAVPSESGARAPVLGLKGHMGPHGMGWGKVRPKRIYNGGVPNGLVRQIHWRSWGGKVAKGVGRGSQYRPGGGYYPRPVKVRLRAKRIGRCFRGGPRAYTVLVAQFQNRPGGRFGNWFLWAGDRTICTRF